MVVLHGILKHGIKHTEQVSALTASPGSHDHFSYGILDSLQASPHLSGTMIKHHVTGDLDDIMTQALIENKVNFVRLLLQNGDVVIHDYLTVPRLRRLYNAAPKTSHLHILMSRHARFPDIMLQDVDKLLRKLMSKHVDEHYNQDNDVRAGVEDTFVGPPEMLHFPKPFRELFIWAVLMNRKELAIFLWERCDEAIPSAIAASRIYDSLAKLVAQYDSDLLKSYKDKKIEFEQLAIKVLNECHNTDPEKAAMLIQRKCATWGDVNCLEMAAAADDKAFLSTVCCQNILDIMWKRGVSANFIKTFLSIIMCPLILCLVKFVHVDDSTEQRTPWQKIRDFYSAPCVKFVSNVMMYLGFLGLYSYMLLFNFRPEIQPSEIIALLWMGTFLLEMLRGMCFDSTADRITNRIYEWWHFSFFNRLDLIVILIALIGVALRFVPDQFILCKSFYAFNCVLLYMRLLRDYSASAYLGPKLVMITKMMAELAYYIMIIVIVLLGYGISIYAVMFPVREFYPLFFKDILYYPFWQISGELYLDEIEGKAGECETAPRINGTRMSSTGEVCPEFNSLVPLLTAAYLLMANVLLLNLLIAIFTHVFEEVQTNSIQIWKYGMYFLVVEYDNKPVLAPPFIIFNHIFLIMKWLARKTCCKKEVKERQYADRQIQLLEVFEKEMTRSYIRKLQKQSGKESHERTIVKIMHGVSSVTKQLDEEKVLREKEEEKLLEHQAMSRSQHKDLVPRESALSSVSTATMFSAPSESGSITKRYSRWPSMDKLRQLQMLGSIKEDGSSDGRGTPTNNYGYTSESVMGSEYNIPLTKLYGNVDGGDADDGNLKNKIKNTDNVKHMLDMNDDERKRDNILNKVVQPKLGESGRANVATAEDEERAEEEQEVAVDEDRRPRRRKSKRLRKKQERKQFLADNAAVEDTSDIESTASRQMRAEYHKLLQSNKNPLDYDEENIDTLMSASQSFNSHRQSAQIQQQNTTEIQAIVTQTNKALTERIQSIEQRLEHMEASTTRSLYNIETMLRNAVFNRGSSSAGSIVYPSSVEMSTSHPSEVFRGLGGIAPPTPGSSNTANTPLPRQMPPYRRNLQFPP